MRRFAGIELGFDRIPDETSILNFRHLLERHGLTQAIFADVNADLADKGISLRSGTLVDVSRRTPCVRVSLRKIIDAPSSTKNKAGARDPEMSSTTKGNDWYFGSEEDQKLIQWINFPTNAHVGVDAVSGVVHSLDTSTAKLHDAASGTRCCTARIPRSGPSCHCRAVAIVSRTNGATMATPSDNGDGYVSAEREAAFKGPGKVWGVRRYKRSPGSFA